MPDKSFKINTFAILLVVCLFSFKCPKKTNASQPELASTDTTKAEVLGSIEIDSLQILINLYESYRDTFTKVKDKIDDLGKQKAGYDKKYKNDSLEFVRLNKELLKLTSLDSSNKTLDSVLAIHIDSIKYLIKTRKLLVDSSEIKLNAFSDSIAKYQPKKEFYQNKISDSHTDILHYTKKYHGAFSIKYGGIRYEGYVANLKRDLISTHLLNPKTKSNYFSINNLLSSDIFRNKSPEMITNAGIYMKNHMPEGILIENYKQMSALDTLRPDVVLNFYLMPNGVFFIDSNEHARIDSTQAFQKKYDSKLIKPRIATQSGPMLIINNKVNTKFKEGSENLNIRSGVGIIDDLNVVFIISRSEVNFYDFALVYKSIFGCNNALYLDGAISLMYLPQYSNSETGGNFGALISVISR